jgi:hypothetical protein
MFGRKQKTLFLCGNSRCSRVFEWPEKNGRCPYCLSYQWGDKELYYRLLEEKEIGKNEHERRMEQIRNRRRY